MKWIAAAAWALAASAALGAGPDISGQVRPIVTHVQAAALGPVAQADGPVPGLVAPPASSLALETELRAGGFGITAVGTARQQRPEHAATSSSGWMNELYWSGGRGGWQFAVGKRIVAWDVGYGFRPNDFVEQEARRLLLATTPSGRPLAMAEYFDASTAVSLVWVNPNQPRERLGAQEPALAARVYQRDGAIDWHGFARWGAHTGGSVGAALAWVAGDSLELHASVRWLDAADTVAIDPAASGLVRSNPWQPASIRHAAQALVGGTWTNADQLSLLAEAWWDGTAPSNAQWNAWNARNAQLAGFIGGPAPAAAVAGNLAWQATGLTASSNLRRANLYARLSWTWDKWQPAIDLFVTPADRGRVVTASLGWQGDRLRLDAGWRTVGGPSAAILPQTPTRRTVYAAATWTF
jgi:hypothetical protein